MTRPRHERLASSPLLEAHFEVRAESGRPFSFLPGAIAGSLAGRYPILAETEIAKIIGMLDIPPSAAYLVTHVFKKRDEKRIVQLGPRGITVTVKDYVDSFDFEEEIKHVLTSYFEHADPKQVFRLGLRYVNGIKENEPLTATFQWPVLEGAKANLLTARAVFHYRQPDGMLGVVVSSPEDIGIRLDLDFWLEPGKPMELAGVLQWFDAAHERVYEAFKSMVKPAVYERWKERVKVNG
jgi:uncharacterized protein (TIGR04255 family)